MPAPADDRSRLHRAADAATLPNLLGLGLDDDAALIVQGDRFQVIGTGRVAVYDNARHPEGWYYWLRPGDQFDLRARKKI